MKLKEFLEENDLREQQNFDKFIATLQANNNVFQHFIEEKCSLVKSLSVEIYELNCTRDLQHLIDSFKPMGNCVYFASSVLNYKFIEISVNFYYITPEFIRFLELMLLDDECHLNVDML